MLKASGKLSEGTAATDQLWAVGEWQHVPIKLQEYGFCKLLPIDITYS